MKSNVSVWAMLPVRGKGLPSHVRGKGVTVSREPAGPIMRQEAGRGGGVRRRQRGGFRGVVL